MKDKDMLQHEPEYSLDEKLEKHPLFRQIVKEEGLEAVKAELKAGLERDMEILKNAKQTPDLSPELRAALFGKEMEDIPDKRLIKKLGAAPVEIIATLKDNLKIIFDLE